MESLERVLGTSRIAGVSRKSLNTYRIAVQSLGRVYGPARYLGSLLDESEYQQDCCEVSRKSLGPAVKL